MLIGGGGIGGLAAALAMARAGRTVRVVEQAPEFKEIGAGLQLGPNAMRAFDRLGVYDAVAAQSVFPARAVVRDALDGSVLTTVDLGEAFRERYGYPYVVAHRSDVLSALLQACQSEGNITLENNRSIASVRETADGAEVSFVDGDRYLADILVGADGIRSRIRNLLDTTEPTFSGHIAYRGALSITDVPAALVTDDVLIWIGPGMHLVQYPVRKGELYNQVAVYERPAGATEARGDAGEFAAAFAVACPEVQRSVALIDTARDWPVFDRAPREGWSTDHAVLIGDAAHAMLQYLGQGACQALEDGLALAETTSKYRHDNQLAFKVFEQARFGLTSRCQTVARPWGALWHTDDPITVALRNRVFRMRRDDDYSELDWLYADRDSTSVSPGTSAPGSPPAAAGRVHAAGAAAADLTAATEEAR